MKHLLYEDAATEIYLEDGEFYYKGYYPYRQFIISYQEFIEIIQGLWSYSEAWKRLKIIEAGKLAGILTEVA